MQALDKQEIMAKLPVIVGFGGVNAAGRSSFHHGYRRTVWDSLGAAHRQQTLQALAALTGQLPEGGGAIGAGLGASLLEHSLIRRIEPAWFDPQQVPVNLRLPVLAGAEGAGSLVMKARYVPEPLPPGWRVAELADGLVRVTLSEATELLLPALQALPVSTAGLLPSGFVPEALYPSRSHPRGLQLAIIAASDALGSLGVEWEQLCDRVSPDQVSVYASSAMGQLDEHAAGGLLASRYRGKRVTSKQLPFCLSEMPADFINAYVLGTMGNTGGGVGACASFLYNLRMGIQDIQSGRARIAVIAGSEAPVVPDVIEGYVAMGALATEEGLRGLDGGALDCRRASRPFSTNCGFTLGEGGQCVVLVDDELALELGLSVYGAVSDVFINADGHKKSIASPGVGNYLTMGRAVAAARTIVGDESLQRRSFVQAHGSSTPQNRVTESHILNETARAFGIRDWPVAAVKAYLGHTLGPASGDQLVSSLGVWAHGVVPGIATIDHVAADVHQSHLRLGAAHVEVGVEGIDVAILNSKGFGGNNASATVLAPHIVNRMLERRHGREAFKAWRQRNDRVAERAGAYDQQALTGPLPVIYKFDHNVLDGEHIGYDRDGIRVPGYGQAVDLSQDSPYSDWL